MYLLPSIIAAAFGLWVLLGPGTVRVRGKRRPRPLLLRMAGAVLLGLGCLSLWLLLTGRVVPPLG